MAHHVRYIEVSQTRPDWRNQDLDYYRILNVEPNCSYDDLRKAFRRMSLQTHPDRFQGEQREKAEKEYQFIVKAFNTLKDPVQRKQYDQTLEEEKGSAGAHQVLESRQKEAGQYEKAGVASYKRGQYLEAAEFLAKAVFLSGSADAYYYKGLAEVEVVGKKKDALVSLQKAIEIDPYQVQFRRALIEAMLKMGLKSRAEKVLEESLGLFPLDRELLKFKESFFTKVTEKGTLKSIFSVFRGKN